MRIVVDLRVVRGAHHLAAHPDDPREPPHGLNHGAGIGAGDQRAAAPRQPVEGGHVAVVRGEEEQPPGPDYPPDLAEDLAPIVIPHRVNPC
ncbi:MAG: hypothetical protein IPL94_08855 [Tetrasphaera sp.]|nr:hypothetical protein [Tetrasphaera sp.]